MTKYFRIDDSERGTSHLLPSLDYNLNEVEHIGTLPPGNLRNVRVQIELTRHHIISWSIIRNTWNRCVDNAMVEICRKLVHLVTEQVTSDQIFGNDNAPDGEELATKLCWAKRNLIIGPLATHRMFDPGESLDFESPLGMSGARLKHVCAMVSLGNAMNEFRHSRLTPSQFAKEFNAVYKDCTKISGDEIYQFVRSEWTLNKKPEIRWTFDSNQNMFNRSAPSNPQWHRSCYSPASVAKYYSENMGAAELSLKTTQLRKAAHTRFVKSLQTS